jgi:Fe2+ or Zn2+ uptake regulation protein
VDASLAARRLREAGYRVTRPRLAVYATLARLGGHRTADEVAAALADAGHGMARMSVYNALDALRGAHLVMTAETGSGAVRHEVADTWHHHFVCRVCGRLDDVPGRAVEAAWLSVDIPGAEVDEAQVVFRGTCAACRDGSAAAGAPADR